MDIEGDAAPQLSEDGARLLADVLSKRAHDRHNSLSSQRDERRRQADALRQDPVLQRDSGDDGSPQSNGAGSRASSPIPDDDSDLELDGGGSGIWMRLLLLIAVGVAIGACIALITSLESRPVDGDDVETVEVDSANSVAVEQVESVGEAETELEVEEAARQAAQAIASESLVKPDDIEVSVYDTSPSNDGVYSFALRLKDISIAEELYTEDFTVRVEDEFGVPATTFSRFVHETLPIGSSALATVRAEEAGPGQQFVVVWYENVAIARIAIENVEP